MKKFVIKKDQSKVIKLTRSGKYVVELIGKGAAVKVLCALQVKGEQRQAVEVVIHHQSRQTKAETKLHGVVVDRAHLDFIGKIIIDPDCGQTQSFLTERILLLSPKATASTTPDLEIMSDDVSCSHAASISQIPESQLFYLQSRGLSRQQAKELIVAGFLRFS